MASKSHSALIIAAVAVGVAAIFGIAAIEGWLSWPVSSPASVAHPGQAAIGIAPVESLSPGESVVSSESAKKPPPPAPPVPPPPAPAGEPAKPAPVKPSYAQVPKAQTEKRRASCPHCGVVTSTATLEREGYFGRQFEVRVRFEDGSRKTFIFPTDPDLAVADRVMLSKGRLTRER